MDEYQGPERRQFPQLSDDQIERIAERAAQVALEKVYTSIGKSVVSKFLWLVGAASLKVYTSIGKSVVSKFLWLVGAASLAVAAWMNGSGHLKL